jgi:hypothetical protein
VRILEEVKKIAHSFSRADSIIRGAIVGAAWGARLPEVQAAACGELKALQVSEGSSELPVSWLGTSLGFQVRS